MRALSARLRRNRVVITKAVPTSDTSRARKYAYQAPEPKVYAVSIAPSSSEEVAPHEREEGVQYLTVKFYEDPGVRVRDRILWRDQGDKILTVRGLANPAAGQNRTWPVVTEYRPTSGG